MVVITGSKQSAQKPVGGARPHKIQPVTARVNALICLGGEVLSGACRSVRKGTWRLGRRGQQRRSTAVAPILDTTTHDVDSTMTTSFAGVALAPTGAAAARIHRQFFRFRVEPCGFHAGGWWRATTRLLGFHFDFGCGDLNTSPSDCEPDERPLCARSGRSPIKRY
jgi:hypothetical protein